MMCSSVRDGNIFDENFLSGRFGYDDLLISLNKVNIKHIDILHINHLSKLSNASKDRLLDISFGELQLSAHS